MRNIRLTIEFDGSDLYGWQYQPRQPTVQGLLEATLAKILRAPTTAYGCSRTDAGVSARNYVANFHTDSRLPTRRFPVALNANLPATVCVKSAEEVGPEFHARFSARGKTYIYRVVRGRSPLRSARAWELRFPVDDTRIARALRLFSGRHDFSRFCFLPAASAPAPHTAPLIPGTASDAARPSPPGLCHISRARLAAGHDELLIIITGDRFLYKMVRRIVGASVAYGSGRLTLADLRNALAGRPHLPFTTAPATGLVLDSVEYWRAPGTPADSAS